MQTMATNGMTWDVIAYQQIGDEFQMDNIMFIKMGMSL